MQKFHREISEHIQYEFTVYSHTPLPTKWRAGQGCFYTGVVFHVIAGTDDNMYIGMSVCSVKDTFNKKIGRAIARGRAEKAMACLFSTGTTRGGWRKLNEISLETPLGKNITGFGLKESVPKGD